MGVKMNLYELHEKLPLSLRYAIAFLIFLFALGFRFLILPVESGLAFLTFYPAAVLAFYICGRGPGNLVIALSAFCGYYIFSPPFWTFHSPIGTVVAVFFFMLSSWLTGSIVTKGHNWHKNFVKAERKLADQKVEELDNKLNQSNNLLEMAERSAGMGSWHWDTLTDKLQWSHQIFEIFGLSSATSEASFETWRKVLHPDDIKVAEKSLHDALENHQPFITAYRIILPSGEIRWIDAYGSPTYNQSGKPIEFSGICIDSTSLHMAHDEIIKLNADLELKVVARTAELIKANEGLEYLSKHDVLTGISNRLSGDERLHTEFLSMKRTHSAYAVMMIDVDFFKKINDTYGHAVGDKVLKALAATLKATIRETDFVARFGGEEFLVLLPHTGVTEAWFVAEKIRHAVESLVFPVSEQITVSIGLAMAMPDQSDQDVAVKDADNWLYAAKKAGRNRVMTLGKSKRRGYKYLTVT